MKSIKQPVLLLILGSAVSVAGAEHADGHGHAHPTTGVQALDVYAQGKAIHLLVADYKDQGPQIFYSRMRANETWTKPVRVDAGLPAVHEASRGHDPAIAASGKQLVAIWTKDGTGFMGSGPLVCARSEDAGKTWLAGANPADDGSESGHAFYDLTADAEGRFHLVWLDSRDGAQGLRYTSSTDGGKTWARNVTLKEKTCECCWNTLLVQDGEVRVLFRDKDPRDMKVVSFKSGQPVAAAPETVGNFAWDFNGCPHVGGGLAVGAQGQLHAIVWTGAAGHSGIHLVSSTDGHDWGFAEPIAGPDSHKSDIGALGADKLVIAWDESSEGFTTAKYVQSANGGRSWSQPQTLSQPGAEAAYPRVVATQAALWVFWTENVHGWPGTWKSCKISFDKDAPSPGTP